MLPSIWQAVFRLEAEIPIEGEEDFFLLVVCFLAILLFVSQDAGQRLGALVNRRFFRICGGIFYLASPFKDPEHCILPVSEEQVFAKTWEHGG